MKKLFTFLAALCLTAAAFAHSFEVDGIYYSITSSSEPYTAAVSYRGSYYDSYSNEYSGDVVIPSSVTYDGTTYAVTSIGSYAFLRCTGLTSVTIPNSVTEIGYEAFYKCTGLTSVTISNSVNSIGGSAFLGCTGLTSVTIPNSVTEIGDNAFADCTGLTSVTIPNSVTSIGSYAFCGCYGLTSVTIGNSVTAIGRSAFSGCSGLTSVTIGNSVTSIGSYAFLGCTGLTSITIPNSVTSIGTSAFYGCSSLTTVVWNAKNCSSPSSYSDAPFYDIRSQITSFTFGNEVESIPDYLCDVMSNLTSVTIPNSVTTIGSSAFYKCTGLTSVTIGNSVTSIGGSAFWGCSGLTEVHISDLAAWCGIAFSSYLSNPLSYAHHLYLNGEEIIDLVIPNSVTSIGSYAFYGCYGLTSITIPNSVTSIGNYAFVGCTGLTSVTIPNSVTSIGSSAFGDCTDLTSVVWNAKNCSSPSSYSYAPFYDIRSQITSFTFGNEVESIPDYLCDGMNNLTSVTIPNSVTSIGYAAFYYCTGLTSVTIPSSVNWIGDNAFEYCSNITKVYCYALNPPIAYASSFANYNAYLYVPCEHFEDYDVHSVWGQFKKVKCIEAGTTSTTGTLTVVPATNDATFTWPANDSANSYQLTITKDGVVFCTLTFNGNGQLMCIAFAPSANGENKAPRAASTGQGWQFTVTGLDAASLYGYTFVAKDASNNVIEEYSGEFATEGYEYGIAVNQVVVESICVQAGRISCAEPFEVYTIAGVNVTRQNGNLPSGVYIVKTAQTATKVAVN